VVSNLSRDPGAGAGVAGSTGVRDPERGCRDLADLTRRAGPQALADVARLAVLLDAILPRCADAGMALANLERFLAAVRSSARRFTTCPATSRMAEILLQVFSTSHYFTEVLIRDPLLLDWLRSGPSGPTDHRCRRSLEDAF